VPPQPNQRPADLEHPDIISPQFYGTSQVLRWEPAAILQALTLAGFSKDISAAEGWMKKRMRKVWKKNLPQPLKP